MRLRDKMRFLVAGYRNDAPDEPVIGTVEVDESKTEIDYNLSYKEQEPLWDARRKEIEDQIQVWADKEGLDKFGYEENYGSYYYTAVSYGGPENPEDEVWVGQDDIHDRLMEALADNDSEYMFLDRERVEMPLWKNRDRAATREEAVKYLARAVSECFPSKSINNDRKDTMQAYADKWEIPLDISLLEQAGDLFNNYDSASWNSSSKYC
jgi:hypothetical protein